MSQPKLGDALGLTFQQVQKYEKGINRISAGRLQQISHILEVPVSFFFDGAAARGVALTGVDPEQSPGEVIAFLATSDGLALVQAFRRIKEASLRRSIVKLVQQITEDDGDRVSQLNMGVRPRRYKTGSQH